jgi:putative transposase
MEPTGLEADELERMAGTARFVWNWALHRSQTVYKANKKGIPQARLSNELTALKSEQPWLYDFDSQSLQQVIKNLKQGTRITSIPACVQDSLSARPQKNAKQSFRIPQRVVLQDGKVYVSKLGWVQVRQTKV